MGSWRQGEIDMGITAEFQRIQVFTGELSPTEFFRIARKPDTLSRLGTDELKILIAEMHGELNNRENGVKDV